MSRKFLVSLVEVLGEKEIGVTNLFSFCLLEEEMGLFKTIENKKNSNKTHLRKDKYYLNHETV